MRADLIPPKLVSGALRRAGFSAFAGDHHRRGSEYRQEILGVLCSNDPKSEHTPGLRPGCRQLLDWCQKNHLALRIGNHVKA